MTKRRSSAGDSPQSVVIVGGGPVGSLAALYFAKRGHQVWVYERRSDPRLSTSHDSSRSINLALSMRGITALEMVGAAEEVVRTGIPMGARMVHGMRASEPRPQPYGVFGQTINSVERSFLNCHLLNLAEALPNVKLHFDHKCESIDLEQCELTFLNTVDRKKVFCKADFVVGCDGAHSKVRQVLMKHVRVDYAQKYIEHGYKELYIPPNKDGSYKMPPNYLHIWPRQQFMLIALPNQDGSFTATLFCKFEDFERIKTREDLLQFFGREFPDAIESIGEELLVQDYFANPIGPLMSVKCSPYHYKDKLIVLGDAAHAMVPFYGQGMNAGFEDVRVLDELYGQFSTSSASCSPASLRAAVFSAYTRQRHEDATAICDLALDNYWEMSAAVLSPIYRIKKAIYDRLHRWLPSRIIPLYTMVSFSNIPYAQAVVRNRRQERWINMALGTTLLMSASGLGCLGLLTLRRLRNSA